MKFRWFLLALIVLTPIGAALMPPPDVPPENPGQGEETVQVVQAVSMLDSPDYKAVRKAIRELNGLADAPDFVMAIDPLIKILSCRDGFYDSYTRCMAAHTLAGIGVTLDWPQGKKAVNAVLAYADR